MASRHFELQGEVEVESRVEQWRLGLKRLGPDGSADSHGQKSCWFHDRARQEF